MTDYDNPMPVRPFPLPDAVIVVRDYSEGTIIDTHAIPSVPRLLGAVPLVSYADALGRMLEARHGRPTAFSVVTL